MGCAGGFVRAVQSLRFKTLCTTSDHKNTLMIPFIDGDSLRRHLPYPALIEALREAFCEPTHAPRRHVHSLSEHASSTLLLMPVWQESRHLGVKLVTVMPENRRQGKPTVHALFILMDATTGTPLALMDGEQLTLRRTAAASALASSYLSRKDSQHMLIVGTGQLAPEMAVAHCAVRPIRTITVWGRDAVKARAMLPVLRDAGIDQAIELRTADALPAAAARADIICCATTSKEPLIQLSDVNAGAHVDLVGGFKPDMREADDALITHARLFVDTFDGALAEAGDLVQPMKAGLLAREQVLAELACLTNGRHHGRSNDQEITLFKSVGTAIEDLAAARLAWDSVRDSRPA